MKTLMASFILLSFFFLISCDKEKPFEIEPEIIPNLCDSTGVLKTNLYAEVWNSTGSGNEWQVRIGDSVRIAEFYYEWALFPCQSLPESLRQDGLELIVSYLDKSRVVKDKGLLRSAELLTIKRINDFPDEDPRNSKNMSTFYVKNDKGKNLFFDGNLIFRNESQWNEFLAAHPEAIPSRKIDFDKYLLVAQSISHGGCGWIYKRSFSKTGDHQFIYKVRAEIYGGCQVALRTYHWVTVPKIAADDIVVFEFEENTHFRD